MTKTNSRPELPPDPKLPDRYRVKSVLGRGGMACVYLVTDLATDRDVALKRLSIDSVTTNQRAIAALFEREFHMLAHLHHPHVIAVYDYGLLSDGDPYYTMELLDGGDLRDRSPLPWQEACRLFFDVASSLALLHSRRMLHRDISPRNIRCTQAGHAKLIDFGAMVPMAAGCPDIVGTPPFIAPETLHRLALDARTDLFSLGATLYYALTARVPYPARSFADVLRAWNDKVVPPSDWAPDVPPALDDLVLSLIQVEPALRPRSAFEVMQRLAALVGLELQESEEVSRAYLSTPLLVGRENALECFREKLRAGRIARGDALCFEGFAGTGRSRLLDACVLEAKTQGFAVARATSISTRNQFATLRELVQPLIEALPPNELHTVPAELLALAPKAYPGGGHEPRPQLSEFSPEAADAEELQFAAIRFWTEVGRRQPLLLTIDDVHRIDASSAAVLAAYLDRSRRASVCVALTVERSEAQTEACAALVRRCEKFSVESLDLEQTHQLLSSLFGETSNLDMLAEELLAITAGNPRQCMELAQHLIDTGAIRYSAGTWTVPVRLTREDLPRSAEAAKHAQLERMTPIAQYLAQCQALAFHDSLRDQDYHLLLPHAGAGEVESAVADLLTAGVLTSDGVTYSLSNRLWIAALKDSVNPTALRARHDALALMYEGANRVAFIYHAFAGTMDEQGLEALLQLNSEYATSIDHATILTQNIAKMMECYPGAHEAAARLGKSLRVRNELRRWHLAGTSTRSNVSYPAEAAVWLERLKFDSGLDLYAADPDVADTSQRLMRALSQAQQRYALTPEAERVYSLEEAIRLLAEYVVFSIMIGVRSQDYALLKTLPPILEPFATLSPVLDAIWQNALATFESGVEVAFERARDRWSSILAKLDAMGDQDVKYARDIGTAIAYGIGCLEAQLGLATAAKWADRLDENAYQRLGGLQLLRIERLQQGDLRNAERYRRQAEVLALRSRAPQMFNSLVTVELSACAKAGDLSGVQDAVERIRRLAHHYSGWVPNLLFAEGCFHSVRGDHDTARAKYEECIALSTFDSASASSSPLMWLAGHQGLAESWLALGDPHRSRDVLERAIAQAHALGMAGHFSIDLMRVLALAEAKLGVPTAVERLEEAIAEQQRLGVTGLQLGLSFEARAQIAIWQSDAAAFERYAELTAREYRYGANSGLGARYSRLVNEAARHSLRPHVSLAQIASTTTTRHESSAFTRDDPQLTVERAMATARKPAERAQVALDLICAPRNASGYLYTVLPTDLVMSARSGSPPQAPEVAVLLDFISRNEDHEAAIDELETDAPILQPPVPLTTVENTVYELLPLACSIDGERRIAGLAVITGARHTMDAAQETQLLRLLAIHLLELDSVETRVASIES